MHIYIYTHTHTRFFTCSLTKKKKKKFIRVEDDIEKSIRNMLKSTEFAFSKSKVSSVKLDRIFFFHILKKVLTLTWGLTKYNRGLALSLSLSSICLRISSLLMLLRTLTSSLDSGAVAVNWIGWATSGSDFFRWRETAAAGIACTKKRNGGKQRERGGSRESESIVSSLVVFVSWWGRERPMKSPLWEKEKSKNNNNNNNFVRNSAIKISFSIRWYMRTIRFDIDSVYKTRGRCMQLQFLVLIFLFYVHPVLREYRKFVIRHDRSEVSRDQRCSNVLSYRREDGKFVAKRLDDFIRFRR